MPTIIGLLRTYTLCAAAICCTISIAGASRRISAAKQANQRNELPAKAMPIAESLGKSQTLRMPRLGNHKVSTE